MSISQREFAEQVVRRLSDAGFTALWAGGCVRDFLVGREPKDYDVATSALPEQVREVFGNRRTLSIGESFGVIVVLGPRSAGQVEVATFRTDGEYLDGRRPESVVFSSLEEDAQRRDFTINGMFYDPLEKQVLDYVGGEQDLKDGILRAIGDPHARMEEDKLRMLRAVRFASSFDFDLDEATADAVRSMADQLSVVSAERIAQELRRMLVDRSSFRAIEICRDLGLLLQIIPELEPVVANGEAWQRLVESLKLLEQPSFSLAFAVILDVIIEHQGEAADADLPQIVGKRLKLSNKEIDEAAWLIKHRRSLDFASALRLSPLKRVLAQPLASDLISLMRVRAVSNDQQSDDALFCEEYLRVTARDALDPPVLITGDDLIKSGLQPGPHFKNILDRVRDAQLELQVTTALDAIELAATLAEELDGG